MVYLVRFHITYQSYFLHQKRNSMTTDSNRKWWALAAVGSGTFMSTINGSIVNIALNTIQKTFGASLGQVELDRPRLFIRHRLFVAQHGAPRRHDWPQTCLYGWICRIYHSLGVVWFGLEPRITRGISRHASSWCGDDPEHGYRLAGASLPE
jgi:hypothetical protein